MKRRNVELETEFAELVGIACDGHSMQGFLRNNNGPTAFVEAFDKEYAYETINNVFGENTTYELYCRARFGEQANLPFFVFIYDSFIDDINCITKYRICVGENHSYEIVDTVCMSEENLIQWWQQQTYHINNPRPYRPQMLERLRESRFDRILEGNDINCENGIKWGQNIDLFIMSEDGNDVIAIVENRFASAESRYNTIASYNPIRQAQNINGLDNNNGDYYSFRNLNQLRNQLDIPFYLATYSRLLSESNRMGICEVYGVRNSDRQVLLRYDGNIHQPSDNIFEDAEEVNRWIRKH